MMLGKKLAVGVVLGLALSITSSFTEKNSFMQIGVVQAANQAVINWDKGAESDIIADGVGLSPKNMTPNRGVLMARRAAIVDAQRQLAEIVQGVAVTGETTVENLTVTSDVVKTKVQALLRGFKILQEECNEDGSYMVRMSIPLYGVNSLAEATLPAIEEKIPQPAPEISANYVPSTEVSVQVKSSTGYTGVIIDAYGMGLEGTFAPALYDTNGRVIYGVRELDKSFAMSQGMVAYSSNIEESKMIPRIGNNALYIKAVSVRGGVNSVNPVNLVVSVEDADKILYVNQYNDFLSKKAVVFIK